MRFYREFCATLPDEAEAYLGLLTDPNAGMPVVAMVLGYNGDLAEGERVLAPARSFGQPLVDLVGPMPYGARQLMLDEPNAIHGLQRYWRSSFLDADLRRPHRRRRRPGRRSSAHRSARCCSSTCTARRPGCRPTRPRSRPAARCGTSTPSASGSTRSRTTPTRRGRGRRGTPSRRTSVTPSATSTTSTATRYPRRSGRRTARTTSGCVRSSGATTRRNVFRVNPNISPD